MSGLRLRDVCTKIGSGATPRGGKDVYLDSGDTSLIRSQNVYNDRFERNGIVYIEQKHADQLSNVEVKKNDVLLNITGDSVARACQVPEDILPARVNQHVAIIRPDPDRVDPRFLRFFLVSPQMQSHMLGLAAAGATRNALTKGMIESFEIPEIDVEEQREIGLLLRGLEEKIDLNRRMNETLEAMARAIFKDWFVDFGPTRAKAEGCPPYLAPELWDLFPDALDDEDKPEGWRQIPLEDLFDVSIGRTPPRKEQHHFVPGGEGRPWISIRDMAGLNTFIFTSEEDLTANAVKAFRVPLIPSGTVVVSFKLTVGRVAITACDMYSNEAIAHLKRTSETPIGLEYTYCFMSNFNYESLASTSSIATAVNSKSIKAIEMLVPNKHVEHAFSNLVGPILDRVKANCEESQTIAQLRDLLLPKLMSGEIRLRDAEKAVEAVA